MVIDRKFLDDGSRSLGQDRQKAVNAVKGNQVTQERRFEDSEVATRVAKIHPENHFPGDSCNAAGDPADKIVAPLLSNTTNHIAVLQFSEHSWQIRGIIL